MMKFITMSDVLAKNLMEGFEELAERNIVGLQVCNFSEEACKELRIKERVIKVMKERKEDIVLRLHCRKVLQHIKELAEGKWKEGKVERKRKNSGEENVAKRVKLDTVPVMGGKLGAMQEMMNRKRKNSEDGSMAKRVKVMEDAPKEVIVGGKLKAMQEMMESKKKPVVFNKLEMMRKMKDEKKPQKPAPMDKLAVMKKAQESKEVIPTAAPKKPTPVDKFTAMRLQMEMKKTKEAVVTKKPQGKAIRMSDPAATAPKKGTKKEEPKTGGKNIRMSNTAPIAPKKKEQKTSGKKIKRNEVETSAPQNPMDTNPEDKIEVITIDSDTEEEEFDEDFDLFDGLLDDQDKKILEKECDKDMMKMVAGVDLGDEKKKEVEVVEEKVEQNVGGISEFNLYGKVAQMMLLTAMKIVSEMAKNEQSIEKEEEEDDLTDINLFDGLDDEAVELLNNNMEKEIKDFAQQSKL